MFGVFFMLVFVIIVIGIIVVFARSIVTWHTNNESPVLNVHAVVDSKRKVESQHMGADNIMIWDTDYYATFRFDSGDTSEFHIKKSDYNYLTEGESGMLYFQGTRFLSFE